MIDGRLAENVETLHGRYFIVVMSNDNAGVLR